MSDPRDMHLSERELAAMTNDLEERHHATLPVMREAIDGWREELSGLAVPDRARRPTRRGFLLGAGAGLGALVLAACGSSSRSGGSAASAGAATSVAGSTPTPATAAGEASGLSGDLAAAGVAAGLENLAVQTYHTALDAAAAGKLGTVPPAVATFATTAMAQHKDHAAAWNSVLTSAGRPMVTGVDVTVKQAVVDPGLAAVKTVPDLAKFALALEDAAAATYLNDIQNVLQDPKAIAIAASIQPVEMQHSAILNFVLGQYPIPNGFAQTTGARPVTDQLG
jgi:hypothetical protein